MSVPAADKTATAGAVAGGIALTPQAATRLRIHETSPEGEARLRRRRVPAPPGASPHLDLPAVVGQVEGDAGAPPALLWREALNRRMLAIADIASASVALVVVLNLLGRGRVGVAALAGAPLMLCLFKVAGLYDRVQLRIVHSTLDEAPALLQLRGLFALAVTILQPFVVTGSLGGDQIAALWVGSFAAIMTGRMVARAAAGPPAGGQRCPLLRQAAPGGP